MMVMQTIQNIKDQCATWLHGLDKSDTTVSSFTPACEQPVFWYIALAAQIGVVCPCLGSNRNELVF